MKSKGPIYVLLIIVIIFQLDSLYDIGVIMTNLINWGPSNLDTITVNLHILLERLGI